MVSNRFREWFDTVSGQEFTLIAKRLSANDTLANGSHQAGPYLPRDLLFRIFPELQNTRCKNPRVSFDVEVDSHGESGTVSAIWYNNRLFGGTRNETRITNWGGAGSSLLDPENTGAICLFAFPNLADTHTRICRIWVCTGIAEEEFVEEQFGPVEPGGRCVDFTRDSILRDPSRTAVRSTRNCHLTRDEIPSSWLLQFPKPREIIKKALELRRDSGLDPDRRLIRRRICEYEIFKSVEMASLGPDPRLAFSDLEDEVSWWSRFFQRRRARAGISLELHTHAIFEEEGLVEDCSFSYNKTSEGNKKPDFLFPSAKAYRNPDFPASSLRMLAVKTTCKDRWRQVLNEANRIHHKHLLTLQEGISRNQFKEMIDSNLQLVIPRPNFQKFSAEIRPKLQTLEDFISEVKLLIDR